MLSNEEAQKLLTDKTDLTDTQIYELLIGNSLEQVLAGDELAAAGTALNYVEEIFKAQIYPAIKKLQANNG